MGDAPRRRRTDKEMPEADAREMLARGYAGRLATVGADGWPYVVPHNPSVRGHLRGNVEHEPRVCFEIDEPGEVFPYGRFECDTSLAYRSVIAFGRVDFFRASTRSPCTRSRSSGGAASRPCCPRSPVAGRHRTGR